MPTTTHRVTLGSNRYISANEGMANVSVIVREQNLRVVIDSVEPAFDTDLYLKVAGRADGRSMLLSVTDLEPGDNVWVRNEKNNEETDLRVVRGNGKVVFSS